MPEISTDDMQRRREQMRARLARDPISAVPEHVDPDAGEAAGRHGEDPPAPPAPEQPASPVQPPRVPLTAPTPAEPPAMSAFLGDDTAAATFETPVPAKAAPVDKAVAGLSQEQFDQLMKVMEQMRLGDDAGDAGDGGCDEDAEGTNERSVARPLHTMTDANDDLPRRGWRRWAARLGFDPGKSAEEKLHDQWLDLIRAPMAGPRVVAVLSVKGGAGKTTIAAALATTLRLQSDRPVAVVDIDPNGTARFLAKQTPPATVQTLADHIRRGAGDIRAYAAATLDGVDIFGARGDFDTDELDAGDVDDLLSALRSHYEWTVIDMPIYTQASAPVRTAIAASDAAVMVLPPTSHSLDVLGGVDEALSRIGGDHLSDSTVIVFDCADEFLHRRRGSDIDDAARDTIEGGRNVVMIPFDAALRTESSLRFRDVGRECKWQFVQLSAAVASVVRLARKGREN